MSAIERALIFNSIILSRFSCKIAEPDFKNTVLLEEGAQFDKLESLENLEVTRLAEGIPIGGEVHYLDENTLNAAYQARKKID